MSILSVILASLTLLLSGVRLLSASPDWSYEDRVLARCDEAWFKEILYSQQFQELQDGTLDRALIDPIEHSKLLLAASVLPVGVIPAEKLIEAAQAHSDPYAAAAIFAYLEKWPPTAGYGSWRFQAFARLHDSGTAPDLEAAFFAHIRDEPSFQKTWGPWADPMPIPVRKVREVNGYTAFADGLASRNRPYMYHEWQRLSRFQKNSHVRQFATGSLRTLAPSPQAAQFSVLVEDIRNLYRLVASKKFASEWKINIWDKKQQDIRAEKEKRRQEQFRIECPESERVDDPQYLAQFVGSYDYVCRCPKPHSMPNRRRPKLMIRLQGKALVSEYHDSVAQWASELAPCQGDEFAVVKLIERHLRFVKNKDGSVTAFETLNGKPAREWVRK